MAYTCFYAWRPYHFQPLSAEKLLAICANDMRDGDGVDACEDRCRGGDTGGEFTGLRGGHTGDVVARATVTYYIKIRLAPTNVLLNFNNSFMKLVEVLVPLLIMQPSQMSL